METSLFSRALAANNTNLFQNHGTDIVREEDSHPLAWLDTTRRSVTNTHKETGFRVLSTHLFVGSGPPALHKAIKKLSSLAIDVFLGKLHVFVENTRQIKFEPIFTLLRWFGKRIREKRQGNGAFSHRSPKDMNDAVIATRSAQKSRIVLQCVCGIFESFTQYLALYLQYPHHQDQALCLTIK